VRDDREGFAQQYARAREIGYQLMADELLEIVDDATNDFMERNGKLLPNHAALGRSRLMVDTRKWLLSNAVYGVTHEDSVTTTVVSVREDFAD
jgi:hypothetical protein